MFILPFNFEDFLNALGEKMLVEAYKSVSPDNPLFEPIHKKLVDRLRFFLIVGGMPEVVSTYVKTQSLLQ